MTYSIGALAKQFGLSRSTLIYYDKIGLLSPSSRSSANYREYTQKDQSRLAKVISYRDAGIPLHAILAILDDEGKASRTKVLESQLEQLNKEIAQLRKQQQVTIELLQCAGINMPVRSMNKDQWVSLLASTGMTDDDMWSWHVEFEKLMPEAHQDFLESLNIPANEISEIRKKSRST